MEDGNLGIENWFRIFCGQWHACACRIFCMAAAESTEHHMLYLSELQSSMHVCKRKSTNFTFKVSIDGLRILKACVTDYKNERNMYP